MKIWYRGFGQKQSDRYCFVEKSGVPIAIMYEVKWSFLEGHSHYRIMRIEKSPLGAMFTSTVLSFDIRHSDGARRDWDTERKFNFDIPIP